MFKSHITAPLVLRFQDLILSLYLYNEERGYREIDRLLSAIPKTGFDPEFIKAIEKHARDEREHYELFRSYFASVGRDPFRVGRWGGYFDRLFRWIWGIWTWQADIGSIAREVQAFSKLCRTIYLAELRGVQQVNWILRLPWIVKNPALHQIFDRVRRDEPSHIAPYQRYLRSTAVPAPTRWEKVFDLYVHLTLSYLIVPTLFLYPGLRRQSAGSSATLTGLASAPAILSGKATNS